MSSHFTIAELTASSTAQRLGIDNSPPPAAVLALNHLMDGLEAVRALLGDKAMHIDSGYRCEQLEKVLCGKDFAAWCLRHGKDSMSWPEYFAGKAHPKGYAADFVCPAFGSPTQIVAFLQGTPLQYDQLLCEGTWTHISFDPRMRRQTMNVKFAADGTPSYEPLGVA